MIDVFNVDIPFKDFVLFIAAHDEQEAAAADKQRRIHNEPEAAAVALQYKFVVSQKVRVEPNTHAGMPPDVQVILENFLDHLHCHMVSDHVSVDRSSPVCVLIFQSFRVSFEYESEADRVDLGMQFKVTMQRREL